MNEKNLDEIAYRRQAFKLFDKGKSAASILRLIPRSRTWLFKWKRRFEADGWAALDSLTKAPQHAPQASDPAVRKLVLRVRHRLEKAKVGTKGAHYLLRVETKADAQRSSCALDHQTLSCATPLWLPHRLHKRLPLSIPRRSCRPHSFIWQPTGSLDTWRAGRRSLAFTPSISTPTRSRQTLAASKTTEVACAHLLDSGRELGLADFLQVDNDAAFTGLGRKGRVFGRFVRLALYLGIELLFIPLASPKRNSLVERVNGLWASHFFNKDQFASLSQLKRKRGKFLRWYAEYVPPALSGLTVREASSKVTRRRLRESEVARLLAAMPLTEGRIHFVRKVDPGGRIELLKESWRVSKTLKGEYVWATIDVKRQTLSLYHRRSLKAKAKLVKQHPYQIEERVEKLEPRFRRRARRVRILQII